MSTYLRLILLHVVTLTPFLSFGQCLFNANNGSYAVAVEMSLTGINFNNCQGSGYNYDVIIGYNITFSGASPPANLYTLQGSIDCSTYNNSGMFFNLPNGGGAGSVNTNANAWAPNPSGCGSDTPTSLGCDALRIQINGPNINNQTVICPIYTPLPITLNYFNADLIGNKALLTWETSSELNNSHFIIEKSTDGSNWHNISLVEGAGNSSTPIKYELMDDLDASETYYRLYQVDFDGKKSIYYYTEVRTTESKKLKLFPNPISDILTIQGEIALENEIAVYNALGKNITSKIQLQQNSHGISANFSNVKSGFYLLKVGFDYYQLVKE